MFETDSPERAVSDYIAFRLPEATGDDEFDFILKNRGIRLDVEEVMKSGRDPLAIFETNGTSRFHPLRIASKLGFSAKTLIEEFIALSNVKVHYLLSFYLDGPLSDEPDEDEYGIAASKRFNPLFTAMRLGYSWETLAAEFDGLQNVEMHTLAAFYVEDPNRPVGQGRAW